MTIANGSVTCLIAAVRQGDLQAEERIWERFRLPLSAVAHRRLHRNSRALVEDEDVVTDAVCSVLRRLRDGQYTELADRSDLWRLLRTVTIHKAVSCNRYSARQKRHGGDVAPVSDEFFRSQAASHDDLLAADAEDFLDHLLSLLPDQELREICVLRLDGDSIERIAQQVGRSVPTIERRLRLIREVWSEVVESHSR